MKRIKDSDLLYWEECARLTLLKGGDVGVSEFVLAVIDELRETRKIEAHLRSQLGRYEKTEPPSKVRVRLARERNADRSEREARESRIQERLQRSAAMWMLHCAGVTYREIGKGFGISGGRVRQIVSSYERVMKVRARAAASGAEPWARRLREAGAI